MKKVFLALVLFAISLNCSSQTFREEQRETQTEHKEISITIQGKVFKCYTTGSGCHYLKRVSKKGSEYIQHLGFKTDKKFKNQVIFSDKKETHYWYFQLTKNGFPKKVKLIKEEV